MGRPGAVEVDEFPPPGKAHEVPRLHVEVYQTLPVEPAKRRAKGKDHCLGLPDGERTLALVLAPQKQLLQGAAIGQF